MRGKGLMKMSIRIYRPTVRKLALVKRPAHLTRLSVLKSEKVFTDNIFKEESSEEANARKNFKDFEDIKTSASILVEVSEIYQECKDEKTKALLGELLTHYNEKLPDDKDGKGGNDGEVPRVTADELLNALS